MFPEGDCRTGPPSLAYWLLHLGRSINVSILTNISPTASCSGDIEEDITYWKYHCLLVRFHVLTAIKIKMAVFWDAEPCTLLEIDRRFRVVYCLHHQGIYHSTQRNIPEGSHLYCLICDIFQMQRSGDSCVPSIVNFTSGVAAVLCIREVQGSNLCPETGYYDRFFCGFPQSHEASASIAPWTSSRPLPSISFSLY
jgi:hypothetical protein